MQQVFTNQTSDGSSSAIEWDRRRYGLLVVELVSGTGEVSLEVSPDGGTTWVDMKDLDGNISPKLTASGTAAFELPACDNVQVRAKLDNESSGDFNAWIGREGSFLGV